MIIYYDTNVLLELQDRMFDLGYFHISNITIDELECIKTSGTKDEEIKYAARQVLHMLDENKDKFSIVPYLESYLEKVGNFSITNDLKIIATGIANCVDLFITNDLSCKTIAIANYLNTKTLSDFLKEKDITILGEEYCGYVQIEMNDEMLAKFYSEQLPNNENVFNLNLNQYLIIKNNDKVVDKYKWIADGYKKLNFVKAESKMFGKVVPKDDYQHMALDMLQNCQISMLRGPAGSGKSYLAFAHMFDMLERGKISKIIIFCNTVATKGSAKLGFYPGSKDEKLLDAQMGNFLNSKIGDKLEVEKMIADGTIVLLPMSDIRGYDTTGMNAAIYITEAQNLDRELMKLALQRIGEDSICILDGDSNAQVDLAMYAGNRNGMRRVSTVFRGSDIYGEVTLNKIHRSKIAELAQML